MGNPAGMSSTNQYLSKTIRLHSELTGRIPQLTKFPDKVHDGVFLSVEGLDCPGFGGSLKHCLLFTTRDLVFQVRPITILSII